VKCGWKNTNLHPVGWYLAHPWIMGFGTEEEGEENRGKLHLHENYIRKSSMKALFKE
jgi:hypothetical protein